MPKLFVSNLGYGTYAVKAEDISGVLKALEKLIPVKQEGYSGPYFLNPDGESPLSHLSQATVIMSAPPVPIPAPVSVEEDA